MIVVVTGAGSGIGRGLVAGFCRDGARVVGIGRTEHDLQETADAFGHGRMEYVVGDVSRREDVNRLVDLAVSQRGRVDVLINNAAVYPKTPFLESSPEDWDDVLRVNVLGVANCCRAVLPGMLERGFGRILNVGSFAWKNPIPGASAYSVSKGAIHVLTSALAREVDRDRYPDVLINEFLPGIYRTRMSDDGEDPMSAYEHARRVVTLPRGGPHGATFLRGDVHQEQPGFRRRIVAAIARRLPGSRGGRR